MSNLKCILDAAQLEIAPKSNSITASKMNPKKLQNHDAAKGYEFTTNHVSASSTAGLAKDACGC